MRSLHVVETIESSGSWTCENNAVGHARLYISWGGSAEHQLAVYRSRDTDVRNFHSGRFFLCDMIRCHVMDKLVASS